MLKIYFSLPEKSYPNGTKYRQGDELCRNLPEESKGIDLADSNGASFLSQTAFHIFTAILLFNFLVFL